MFANISAGAWVYGTCSDRYVSDGYKDKMDFDSRVERLSNMEEVKGIEITYPFDINEENYDYYKTLLQEKNLTISCMGVELVCDRKWKTGSFCSPHKEVREETIKLVKKAMDFANQIGVETVNLWLGQDGFDYLMQTNYVDAWKFLIEGLRECANYNTKVRLGLEYKASEPRLNCFLNSGGKALAVAQATGCSNVGVTLDIGHALNARENPAEIASVLMAENRLFHLHFNGNYFIADDDMPVGSVHFLHFVELIYWLKKLGYSGWYSLDLYPYRDDPDEACKTSIHFIRMIEKMVEKKLKDLDFHEMAETAGSKNMCNLFTKMFNMGE